MTNETNEPEQGEADAAGCLDLLMWIAIVIAMVASIVSTVRLLFI
jgi:hypothetical protein